MLSISTTRACEGDSFDPFMIWYLVCNSPLSTSQTLTCRHKADSTALFHLVKSAEACRELTLSIQKAEALVNFCNKSELI